MHADMPLFHAPAHGASRRAQSFGSEARPARAGGKASDAGVGRNEGRASGGGMALAVRAAHCRPARRAAAGRGAIGMHVNAGHRVSGGSD
jgi:hypothetical protein